MLEVLARVHAADEGEPTAYGTAHQAAAGNADEDEDENASDSDGSEGDDALFPAISSILSEATKAKLRQRAQAAFAAGEEPDIDPCDLTAAERAALERLTLQQQEEERPAPSATAHAAVQQRQAPAGAAPRPSPAPTIAWVPWWQSDEARALVLSPAGQPLVAEVSTAANGLGRSAADSSGAPTALPLPPSAPLPPLSALTRGAPSPLLRWQLLQLLFGYCCAARLRQQQRGMDALLTAEQLLALAPALDPPAAAGTAESNSSGLEATAQPAALDARTALPPVWRARARRPPAAPPGAPRRCRPCATRRPCWSTAVLCWCWR